jgi:hypothetical protein
MYICFVQRWLYDTIPSADYESLFSIGKENAVGYTMVPQNSRRLIKVNDKELQEQLMYRYQPLLISGL